MTHLDGWVLPLRELEFCSAGSEFPRWLKPVACDSFTARLKARPFKAKRQVIFRQRWLLQAGYQQSDTVPEGRLYADLGSFRVSLAQPLHAGPGFRTMKAA